MTTTTSNPKCKRRWFAFRLRTLFWATACVAILAWLLKLPYFFDVVVFDADEEFYRRLAIQLFVINNGLKVGIVLLIFYLPYCARFLMREIWWFLWL